MRTDSPIMVIDPYASGDEYGNLMGYLRSLPYLFEKGVDQYTFAQTWLRYGLPETFDEAMEETEDGFKYDAIPGLDFNYNIIRPDEKTSEIRFPLLCQYTSQEMEDEQSKSTTYQILRSYQEGNIDEFFMIVDTPKFKLNKFDASKPLAEEMEKISQVSYEELAKRYVQEELGGSSIGWDTLNIWLHKAAKEYEESSGSSPNRIADLFDFDKVPSDVRTWDILEFLASDLTQSEPAHIQATVRPWIEKDISLIKTQIHNILQDFEYSEEKVKRHRGKGHS